MVASPAQPTAVAVPRTFGPLAVAGFASIGAGAIHAAAAVAHGDHRQTALVFQVLALAQIGWGAWATIGERRLGAALGALLSAGAVVGWAVAQTAGVSFIDGLEDPHGIEWADGIGAMLAFLAFAATARWLLTSAGETSHRNPTDGMLFRLGGGVVVAVLALGGVSQTTSHGEGHSHGDETAGGHAHEPAVVPPITYDPEAATSTTEAGSTGTTPTGEVKRVDLSGVPGVTAEEQARAEALVELTLDQLPQFADVSTIEEMGFRSIGDGFTGHEHYINWSYIDDDKILDPNYPESLVYDTSGLEKKLVSAMFMLPQGSTLDSVPDVGGPLTQWHIHDDLCFTDDEEQPRVAGVTSVGGECTPPLKKFTPVPMIHVWIVGHPCGPFAALEGVAAGQVKPGEEHLCTEEHGSGF